MENFPHFRAYGAAASLLGSMPPWYAFLGPRNWGALIFMEYETIWDKRGVFGDPRPCNVLSTLQVMKVCQYYHPKVLKHTRRLERYNSVSGLWNRGCFTIMHLKIELIASNPIYGYDCGIMNTWVNFSGTSWVTWSSNAISLQFFFRIYGLFINFLRIVVYPETNVYSRFRIL